MHAYSSKPTQNGWDLSEEGVEPNTHPEQWEDMLRTLSSFQYSGSKRFRLNLAYSRLSRTHLKNLISLMAKHKQIDVDLKFCGLSLFDVQNELADAECPRWIEQGRVNMATSGIELQIEKFLKATNKRCKDMEDWQDIEDKELESEMMEAVSTYLADNGYNDVNAVQLKKIFDEKGQVMLEVDGMLAATKDGKLHLCTIEAKHSITQGNISKRVLKNQSLEALLAHLRTHDVERLEAAPHSHVMCCAVLKLFAEAEVQHFIGGVHFSEEDCLYAHKQGFSIITSTGDMYHITPCTSKLAGTANT